jgi:hypothetical protein
LGSSVAETRPIGLIAGNGSFPSLFARAASEQGLKVVCVAHKGETDPAIDDLVWRLTWVDLGQLGKLLSALKEGGVGEVVMAGGISKNAMYRARPDLKAVLLLARVRDRSDDAILRALATALESEGFKVSDPTVFLADVLAPAGRIAGPNPTPEQMKDAQFGFRLAREIGRLDVGQTVVVKGRSVVAVEAMEGTDRCIERAGGLCGPGAVVVKVCKPGQDVRFDLPAVGPGTIDAMAKAGANMLAVEAGRTIMLERTALLAAAAQARITLLGIDAAEVGGQTDAPGDDRRR